MIPEWLYLIQEGGVGRRTMKVRDDGTATSSETSPRIPGTVNHCYKNVNALIHMYVAYNESVGRTRLCTEELNDPPDDYDGDVITDKDRDTNTQVATP